MSKRIRIVAAVLLAAGPLYGASDGHKQIGMVIADGPFTIDHVQASGSATVFEGDEIVTGTSSSRVHLKNGVDFQLAPGTTGVVYTDHVVVQSGSVVGTIPETYALQGQNLVLHTTQVNTKAAMQIDSKGVTMAVPSGTADVTTSDGVLVSHLVPAGPALNFATPEDGSSTSREVRVVGVLDHHGNHFLVRDRTTNLVSEIQGSVPNEDVNKLVEVRGELLPQRSVVANVDRVLSLSQIKRAGDAGAAPCFGTGGGGGKGDMKHVTVDGILSQEKKHYLVTNADHHTYEVLGNLQDSQVGTKVHIKGYILENRSAYPPAETVLYAEDRRSAFLNAPCVGLITGGILITTGILLIPGGTAHSGGNPPVSF